MYAMTSMQPALLLGAKCLGSWSVCMRIATSSAASSSKNSRKRIWFQQCKSRQSSLGEHDNTLARTQRGMAQSDVQYCAARQGPRKTCGATHI